MDFITFSVVNVYGSFVLLLDLNKACRPLDDDVHLVFSIKQEFKGEDKDAAVNAFKEASNAIKEEAARRGIAKIEGLTF